MRVATYRIELSSTALRLSSDVATNSEIEDVLPPSYLMPSSPRACASKDQPCAFRLTMGAVGGFGGGEGGGGGGDGGANHEHMVVYTGHMPSRGTSEHSPTPRLTLDVHSGACTARACSRFKLGPRPMWSEATSTLQYVQSSSIEYSERILSSVRIAKSACKSTKTLNIFYVKLTCMNTVVLAEAT